MLYVVVPLVPSNRNFQIHGKDHFEIREFDVSDFAFCKNQMCDAVVQRRQMRPLGGKAKKPDDVDNDDRKEVDALTMSTIRLHLADSVYFTVLDSKNSEELWKKLRNTYGEGNCSKQSVFDEKAL